MSDYIGTADIAADLGLAREYVTDKLTKRQGFPPPALVLSQKVKLWLRDEYHAWKDAEATASARSARRSHKHAR